MIDWQILRTRLRLETVAEDVLGPPAARKGRRLLWCCPLHQDNSPSLEVDTRDQRWRCWPCRKGGDAARMVMEIRRVNFPEALRWLADRFAPDAAEIQRPPATKTVASLRQYDREKAARKAAKAAGGPSGLPASQALALAQNAAQRLWEADGAADLEYLRERGLTDATIRDAQLGSTGPTRVPNRDGDRWFQVRGITIPWFDGDRLVMLKIRQPDTRTPREAKYVEAFRYNPRLYPGPEVIRPGQAIIVSEGELDCLLLAQQLEECPAVTLGSTSGNLDDALSLLLVCPVWYAAHDADPAGEHAALALGPRAIRMRPPPPGKDWTDVHAGGWNRIRYHFGGVLGLGRKWAELEPKGNLREPGEEEELPSPGSGDPSVDTDEPDWDELLEVDGYSAGSKPV